MPGFKFLIFSNMRALDLFYGKKACSPNDCHLRATGYAHDRRSCNHVPNDRLYRDFENLSEQALDR